MIGIVQKFSQLHGYGFLLQDFKTTRFFHVKSWNSDIPPKKGMKVTYDLAPSRKPGMPDAAINIVPVVAPVVAFERDEKQAAGVTAEETSEFLNAVDGGIKS